MERLVTRRQYVRDIALMTAVAVAMVLATALAGPFAALCVLGAALIAGAWHAVTRKLEATDEWCARIDRELDQEREAREALRAQRTVHAEPQAPVVDITTRKPIA